MAALSGGLAFGQVADELEDFEPTVILGAPETIGTIETPDIPLPAPEPAAPDLTFGDALLAYETGDPGQALVIAKVAGAAGDARAQVLAGHILMRGETGLVDDFDAVSWLRRAAEQGNVDAMLALGEMSVGTRGGLTPQDAVNYYKQAADAGDTQAMRALSTLAGEGLGVKRDVEVAAAWEETAAGAGDVEAMRRRGEALMDSNPVEALRWLEEAARAGDGASAYAAAILRLESLDIPPDERAVARLLKQAADAGIAAAEADYGLVVYQGAGVTRDVEAAAELFRRAAEGGDAEGQFLWAFTLAKGEGVEADKAEAYYWLLRSGESGVAEYDESRRQLREGLEAVLEEGVMAEVRGRVRE